MENVQARSKHGGIPLKLSVQAITQWVNGVQTASDCCASKSHSRVIFTDSVQCEEFSLACMMKTIG